MNDMSPINGVSGFSPDTIPKPEKDERKVDIYFSADVETDGPIPGPYSMLSFAIVYAGQYDGIVFHKPDHYEKVFYAELAPISTRFLAEALAVNGLDRKRLIEEGEKPNIALTRASKWIREIAGRNTPVLVAYPVSFDWTWLYWYFTQFSQDGSPFGYSNCYDIKTAAATKLQRPISLSGRSKLPELVRSKQRHTHHAVDDAKEQAEIFANIFNLKR